jgi:hypothetical protein
MSRRKKTKRRRASLSLEPHVLAALQRVRHAYTIMNRIPLLDDISDSLKLGMFVSAVRDFSSKAVSFSMALECSVDDPTQPPSITIKE